MGLSLRFVGGCAGNIPDIVVGEARDKGQRDRTALSHLQTEFQKDLAGPSDQYGFPDSQNMNGCFNLVRRMLQ